MNFEEITVEKIPQSIVTQIRRRLIDGELKPGQSLPSEVKLAKMFGVSRSSIRDAMQILESTGVVTRRKRGGTTIRQITIEDMANIYLPKSEKENLFDLLETREILEIAVVRLAAQRAAEKDIRELELLIDWMEEKPEEAAEADVAFHLTLAIISQNEVILNIIKSLKEIMSRLQEKTIYYPGRIDNIIIEHKQIVSAIKENNEHLAQEYMRNHLDQISDLLKKL